MDLNKRVRVVTAPTYEPVTLAEAKLWCRIDDDDTSQDAKVLMLIIAMREYAEELTGQVYAERTFELRMDGFPDGVIEIPHAPLQSVSSFQYVDSAGDLHSLDASPLAFQVDTVSKPGRVAPLVGSSWPAAGESMDAVRIQYVAGYPTPNSIPKKVRLWMETMTATLYANREQFAAGYTVANLPRQFVEGLLDGVTVHRRFA